MEDHRLTLMLMAVGVLLNVSRYSKIVNCSANGYNEELVMGTVILHY